MDTAIAEVAALQYGLVELGQLEAAGSVATTSCPAASHALTSSRICFMGLPPCGHGRRQVDPPSMGMTAPEM